MQNNLNIVKKKQDNLIITAPISGHITSLDAEIGQSKSIGQRLGQIDVLDHFKVRSGIDEHYIARVEKGKTGEFEFAEKTYHLIVKQVYLEVQEGRFEVDMEFTGEEPHSIRRGQTFHISLQLGGISEEIILPRGGFYQTTGGNWIFIVDKSGKFATKKPIKLGMYNTYVYQVLEGLEPGDRVITSSYESFGNAEMLILK